MPMNRRRAAADLYEQAMQTLEDALQHKDWNLVQAVVLALREWMSEDKPALRHNPKQVTERIEHD